ncbi:MAG: peptide-methionine (S)-S-oxide reductase MsrA, partial [Lentimicrobiaceae bacterium]|nr:peptide-methionine (S)-S-oxide reductase MsrA [Lentimicrobiaceae bacterium]
MKLNSKTLLLLQIFFFVSLSNITYSQNKANSKSIMNTEIATFGSGCFWCTEAIFERVDGVKTVEPGFAGGTTKNPTYKEVVSGETGHAEVTQITFNPEKISYEDLLEIFWQTHDPTTLNRQGADYG